MKIVEYFFRNFQTVDSFYKFYKTRSFVKFFLYHIDSQYEIFRITSPSTIFLQNSHPTRGTNTNNRNRATTAGTSLFVARQRRQTVLSYLDSLLYRIRCNSHKTLNLFATVMKPNRLHLLRRNLTVLTPYATIEDFHLQLEGFIARVRGVRIKSLFFCFALIVILINPSNFFSASFNLIFNIRTYIPDRYTILPLDTSRRIRSMIRTGQDDDNDKNF